MNHWVTVWATSLHGSYPHGTPLAQPDLALAIPDPARGLCDQAVRMVLHPAARGPRARVRLSNAHGDRPLTLAGLSLGEQWAAASLLPGSRVGLTVQGQDRVTLAPGESCWSDPVALSRAAASGGPGSGALALSGVVCGASGRISWHSKAMGSSYLGRPGHPAAADDEDESGLPFATTSWFWVDALDMELPGGSHCVVCLGDSLTDGTGTTLNGRDRWTDQLQRLLTRRLGPDAAPVCIVNAGIGGNQVVGSSASAADGAQRLRRGPPAVQRLAQDVLALSGVGSVIWLEGINDFSDGCGASVEAVIDGFRQGASRLHAAGLRVIGATVPSGLGAATAGHGGAQQDERRRRLNTWLRQRSVPEGVFDSVIDMDAALTDPVTGAMRAAYVPDGTLGGPGDHLHPNRAGHLAMAAAVDLDPLLMGV
ncbi:MAG: lysophospholipase [Rhodoferax sp.]|nr:lysophospholipase [Rhodoferax sp.]